MTIDALGMLWVAMCHGGSVLRINPANGSLLQKIDFPCVETTACTFGGEKLDRLFVTTGIHKSIEESNAGRLFVVDGLGVNGTKAFAFCWISNHEQVRQLDFYDPFLRYPILVF